MNSITLNLVVLRSPDITRAAAFYSRLGLEFTRHQHGSGAEHFAAELSGSVFELYPLSQETPSTLGSRVGFSVPSLDDAIVALNDYPGSIISAPNDSPWGRRAVVADPDGHRVELLQQ
jgi:lactoylglutathione lyase